MKFLHSMRGAITAAIFALVFMAFSLAFMATMDVRHAFAQSFTFPPGTVLQGMMSGQGKSPVATGCTLVAGSTDADGTCTTTTTSGAIVFAKTDAVNPPFCIVSDGTATPVAVYTVTAQQITLTTVTSAHVLRYHCILNGS